MPASQASNFAATSGNTTAGVSNVDYMTATIDQVMAYSNSFYGQNDLDRRMTQRSLAVRNGLRYGSVSGYFRKFLGKIIRNTWLRRIFF